MEKYQNKLEVISMMLEVADNQTPNDIAIVCRQVLEKCIDLIFEICNVRKPIGASLLELINHEIVKEYFDNDILMDELHFVRIVGANAHHDKQIKKIQAKVAYDNTMKLLSFMNEKQGYSIVCEQEEVTDNVESVQKKLNEIQTRKIYIDLYLGEAGWEVLEPKSSYQLADGTNVKAGTPMPAKSCSEIMIKGLQNHSGVGFCDYVLYDRNGKPLAIVEAKKTTVDPLKGQQQVREYGKCMEKEYGYIPVLYYTNGYEIYVIDGKYPPRKVSAFHTLDELQYLIQKRSSQGIIDMNVKENIAGRQIKICYHIASHSFSVHRTFT